MSGIFGIFNRNGKPVEEKIVNTMLEAMSYWKPDDRGTWIDGSVALGHTMLWNTPESKYEHFPLEKDAYVLTMDARIDNREELAREIELPDRPMREIGDSEFILGAYKKWGEECPKHLLGDFVFAIWDEEKQHIFCARDHIGIKPFYYHLSDNLFIFSNDIRTILAHIDIRSVYNDNAVALYLTTNNIAHNEWTFYEDIIKLPEATSLMVSCSNIQKEKYWTIAESPTIRYNTDDEYAQHLYQLVEESIRVRQRSLFPVGSHLSGGLDSSSIAVIAARMLKERGVTLSTFSWVPEAEEDDNVEDFEWAHCKQLATKEEMLHYHVCLEQEDYVEFLKHHNITYGDTKHFWSEMAVRKKASQKGIRTLLSGWGGDELITYNGNAYFRELALEENPLFAISKMCNNSRNPLKRLFSLSKRCFKTFILPELPYYISHKLQGYAFLKKELPYYVKDEFREKITFEDIPIENFKLEPTKVELFEYGHIQRRIESWSAAGMEEGIEYAYPLLDKRIVEFALGIPSELFAKKGKRRYIYRLAMEGILPSVIQWGDFKEELNGDRRVYGDIQKAAVVWTKSIDSKNNKYIDINKLIWMIECFQDDTCIVNDKRLTMGNIEVLDYIQGILLYSATIDN